MYRAQVVNCSGASAVVAAWTIVERTREPDCFPEAAGPLGKKRELEEPEEVSLGYRYGGRK